VSRKIRLHAMGALTALWACLGSKLSTYYLNLFDDPFDQGVPNWRSSPFGSGQILDHGSDTAKASREVVEMGWPVIALDHPPLPIHNGTLRSASIGRLAKWKDRAASLRPRRPAHGNADTPESLRGETTIDETRRATAQLTSKMEGTLTLHEFSRSICRLAYSQRADCK
jgi:hypothetical protein